MSHELREHAPAAPAVSGVDVPAPPRGPRSPAFRVAAIAVVAAVSGATAGALVGQRTETKAPAAAAVPGTAARFATPDVAGVAAAVAPAVVSISTHAAALADFFSSRAAAGEGTGTVIRSDGMIITAATLVSGGQPITVGLGGGRFVRATVVGRDDDAGIAVLKVATTGLPTARLADIERLRVGDDVVTLDDALALPDGPTVGRGVVAALHRTVATARGTQPARLANLLEVTNGLGPQHAGAPVIDTDGNVVGIATSVENGDQPPGFAIDVVAVGPVVRAIEEGRVATDPVGVDAIDVTPALARDYALAVESGALVVAVTPNSPAVGAGLRPDDIVVELDHQRVATAADLARAARDPSATSVRLSVVRGRRSLTLTVRLVD